MGVFYFIDTYQGHIALGYSGLFYHMLDHIFVIDLCHTKAAGVIYFFYPQHIMAAVYYLFNVVITNGIAQCYYYFISIDQVPRQLNSMPRTLPFILMYEMAV